jgi:aminoglycoside phosphotransferase family enzyme
MTQFDFLLLLILLVVICLIIHTLDMIDLLKYKIDKIYNLRSLDYESDIKRYNELKREVEQNEAVFYMELNRISSRLEKLENKKSNIVQLKTKGTKRVSKK